MAGVACIFVALNDKKMINNKFRKRITELRERLDAENNAFHNSMNKYESMPEEVRLEIYREVILSAEGEILSYTGNPLDVGWTDWESSKDELEIVAALLGRRYYALSKMFEIHCSDAEVARIETLNERLLALTGDMFDRTSRVYRHILDLPVDEKVDDIDVKGELRYWSDGPDCILRLEDDAFYGSEFMRMIPVIAYIEEKHYGDLEIMSCYPHWVKDPGLKSSMSDKELGLENTLDDGVTWAEGWLRHQKLDHIVMCYATHALVTHAHYSVPDFMRLNCFEAKVEVKVQQFSEQDGSRWWKI